MMRRMAVLRMAALGIMLALGACAAHVVPGTPAASGVGYPVFFDEWSAGLSDEALKSIAAAADSARAHPGVPILVSGFAANDTGSNAANRALARARAINVRDQLVTDGIDPGRVKYVGEGPVSYTLDPIEARRVTISVGQR